MDSRRPKPVFHVLFGGTFDPPHLAHHEMLKVLLADELVDFVHLVPARLNPHKVGNTGLGTGQDRREWVHAWLEAARPEIALAQMAKLRVEWLEMDASITEPSYTIDTLTALRTREGDQGAWIVAGGSDLLRGLKTWKDALKLLAMLHSFWVFPREGSSQSGADLDPELRAACAFRWMSTHLMDVSSSRVRELMNSVDASNALQNLERLPLLPAIRKSLAEKLSRA